jgi:hypothetical protein
MSAGRGGHQRCGVIGQLNRTPPEDEPQEREVDLSGHIGAMPLRSLSRETALKVVEEVQQES